MQGAGKTFVGYVESPKSKSAHNPWESFPEDRGVGRDFGAFPASDFTRLPTVAFVIPNLVNDMHDGTIAQGDAWLKRHFSAYAQWAQSNNSLLMVVWDENDNGTPNQVVAIFHGAHVQPGPNDRPFNHYNTLATILASHGLVGPGHAAKAAPIGVFGGATVGLVPQPKQVTR